MKIKYKTTKNKFPDMISSLQSLSGKKIEVGAIAGEHNFLAAIHEYG